MSTLIAWEEWSCDLSFSPTLIDCGVDDFLFCRLLLIGNCALFPLAFG